ncbi:MAG: 2-dehydropantoate 2-reductase N-terminal domain-containing protein, partial [Tepidiformaceae bacterium]
MPPVAVVGATSWGVTLAWLLAERGHDVRLVTRDTGEAAAVRSRRGLERLPGVVLAPSVAVIAAGEFEGPLDGLVIAVPAQSVRSTLAQLPEFERPFVLSAAKGIE